ncbi:LysR substrate-binding domain-containing protein [Roseitalea porphyridii]|uniref:LysR family transcriptional regulator n=1 Tax=Roseitalea porphyridii TaxID=1852022 RepID=A0A4P6UYH0_9HYPH|nr:LysR substrate-binding domain-containing protein [Roseitalea porphyridii]QBK30167.1 LysR family transcriptional regulator [Roseitalea porphyridii]
MPQLDSDLLRTFLAVAETGSVTAGAARIGRSQSATSLQIKQLEGIVGQRLFARHGRGVRPTDAGERLVPVARRVTQSLDAVLTELRGESLRGRLRIGLPDDQDRAVLTGIVADFAARHPEVQLDVHCALGAGYDAALGAGALDLAVFAVPEPAPRDVVLRRDDLVWMARTDRDLATEGTLPVALFDRDCWWRDVALAGLESAGQSYRIVFTSESALGVRAAVEAGIAAGLLDRGNGTDALGPVPDLDFSHPSFLVLRRAPSTGGDALEAMSTAIRRAFSVAGGGRHGLQGSVRPAGRRPRR